MRDQASSPERTLEGFTCSFRSLADESQRLYAEGNQHKTSNIKEDDLPNPEEAVNHPKHYNSHPSGVECIEITEHYNFCVGNAIKYVWRAGLKGTEDDTKHTEDLKKAVWYLNREIERLGKFGKS